tara:strand:+ start:308 stop:877 length:570 start_codon:yes stop_codon:yes gene_type:complete
MKTHLNKTFFKKIAKEYSELDAKKRQCNIQADKALHTSKRAIFAMHRGDVKQAKEEIAKAAKMLKALGKFGNNAKKGPVAAANEEFAEASLFMMVVEGNQITSIKGAALSTTTYYGALSDVVGEIVRLATKAATIKDIPEVARLANIAEDIMAELYTQDFTGYLRQKFDQAKSHSRKLEHIAYELSLRE